MPIWKRVSAVALLSGAVFVVCLFIFAIPGAAAGISPVRPTGFHMPDRAGVDPLHIWINQSQSSVYGNTQPGTTVTLTLMRAGAPVDVQTRTTGTGVGFFFGLNGNSTIQVNDTIKVMTSIGVSTSVDVIPMSGMVVTSTISGHINAPTCPAAIQAEVGTNDFPSSINATTDGSCNYHVDFSPFEVHKADMVAVWYVRPDNNMVGIVRSVLRAQVDLDNDSINGNVAPNAPVTVTLRGVTYSRTADDSGNYGIRFNGVDLIPGDVLTVSTGAESVTIHAPLTLTVSADPDTNLISGYGPSNALMQLDVGNVKGYQLTTTITGYYNLTTNAGSPLNWDLQPQDMGQIGTLDENRERVYVHFGAVDLALNMNDYGGGRAAPGGRYVYELRVRSQQVPASDVVITDTLPLSASLVSVSGGYPFAQIGNRVVITMGLLHAEEEQSLLLTVAFDPLMSPGDSIHNEAVIGSPQFDANTGNNTASHDMRLLVNNTDLSVNKKSRTGDPLNGEQMIWEIGYNNQGNTGSVAVRLTDTLPVSTTFVRWWSDDPGWTLVQTGTQVVWVRDTLPGYWDNRLYLVIALDPALSPDTQLHNEASIYTPNDTNNSNDTNRNDVRVGRLRRDVSVRKYYDNGSTVAGRSIMYGIDYNNNGNTTAHHVLVTDTLPLGTSLTQSGYGTQNGWVDIPYAAYTGNTYVWDLGDMIPGTWGTFQLRVQIDADLSPGTVLTNHVIIGSSDGDDAPWNNTSSIAETVYPSGPNLRVWKEARWNWPGELQYTIHIENHGDSAIGAFVVTETYPLSTSLGGWNRQWQPGYVKFVEDTSNPRYAVFNIDQLQAGDTIGIQLRVSLDGSIINQPGLHFVDLLTAALPPGDTYPADNTFTQVSGSGADLFATNQVVAGRVRPGEVITFQVLYGNLSDQWEGSGQTTWLVYQLPDGFSLVSASPPPNAVYGQYLLWLPDKMGRGWRSMVEVSARVPMSAKLGDAYSAVASLHDTNSVSVEPDYVNNTSTTTAVWAITGRCYVPIVMK
jgi:uncharacterized repeat protein (TIGR01451 family)